MLDFAKLCGHGDFYGPLSHCSRRLVDGRQWGTPECRHLKVVTDERGACRRRSDTGRCIESDTIFSLAEQRHPPVIRAALTTDVEVVAGHVEIVGESGVTPHKLIEVFQREGIVRATPPERQSAFQALLAQLYGQ